MQRTAGFVLMGGRSSRMGQDKARLKVGAQTLVEIAAAAVRAAAGSVGLVGGANPGLPFEWIPDLRAGFGPLAGVEAALLSGRGEFNLIAACDMPDLEPEPLRRLLSAAEESESHCAVAVDAEGRRHPLCAVYHASALGIVQAALDEHRLRLLDLVEELAAVDVSTNTVLRNLNTPEEWAQWRTTAS